MGSIDDAIEAFWRARQGGGYPVEWGGQRLSQVDAYKVNLALTERHLAEGRRQVGWKVGLTAQAIRDQFGLPEPVFGVLFEDGRWPSGGTRRIADFQPLGWENELCLTMGESLRGPGITEESARKAVATVAPAMEIIETRGPATLDLFNVMIADNAQQRAYVVGEEVPYDPAAHDLGAATVDILVDGQTVETGKGDAVMESGAIASVVWLANKLAEHDRALEAGAVIMSGSFTRQFPVDRPMKVEVRFEPFGKAEVTFE